MEYYEQMAHSFARPLLPADMADDRLEKLEAVLRAAQEFIVHIEELVPGGILEMCPELAYAVRRASV